ncbi:TetR/AcrR family transcriptional regulator [Clostridium saccharoperbutylacetonicum]|uniref:TetR/AcrR family transcriptional regulator n=1 Tax=Clostridium saccharoperbutylacetonicum TaxID=36745 RepID=UPI0039E84C21
MGMLERKEKEKQIRRNDIINAAEKVFVDKAFENSTMDDIAKEAEFTKKTIYSYFSSKEELYYEIMLKGFLMINELVEKKLSKIFDKTESEKIKTMGMCFIEFKDKYPAHFKAMMDYQNKDEDFHSKNKSTIVGKCYEEGEVTIDILKKCVARGIETGEFSNKIDPIAIVFTLWSHLMGLIWLIDKKEKYINNSYNKTMSELIDVGFEIVINSIRSN